MSSIHHLLSSVLACYVVCGAASAQNLVQNGSFEIDAYGGCGYWCESSCNIPNWTNSRIDLWQTGSFAQAHDGEWLVQLNGCTTGSVEQWVATVPGQVYRVQFSLGARGGGDGPYSMQASAGGAFVAGYTIGSAQGSPVGQMHWEVKEFEFTAQASSSLLRFASTNGGSNGAWLDAISAVQVERPECILEVPGEYATIQGAINAASTGTPCLVLVSAGMHAGPIDFLGKDIVVRGEGAGKTIIAGTGGQSVSVVRFSGGEPATAALENVTVRNGLSGTPFPGSPQFMVGGGLFSYNSAASIHDCVFENNVTSFGGGAYIWNSTGAIANCIFRLNAAGADGGGILVYKGDVMIVDTVFEGNQANSRGGGVHLVEGTPHLLRTTVRANTCNNLVGGLSWAPVGVASAYLTMEDCVVTANLAYISQGGIGVQPDGALPKLSLAGTTVCSNAPLPNISGAWTNLGGNTVCLCVGDITLDGAVDGADLGQLLAYWGPVSGVSAAGDFNEDGTVNGADLGLLLGNWGPCSP